MSEHSKAATHHIISHSTATLLYRHLWLTNQPIQLAALPPLPPCLINPTMPADPLFHILQLSLSVYLSSIFILPYLSVYSLLSSTLLLSLLRSIRSFIFSSSTFFFLLSFSQLHTTPFFPITLTFLLPFLPFYPSFPLPSLLPPLCTLHSTGQPACFCHLMTRTCWGHSHGVQHLEDVLIERKNNAPQVR